MKSAVGTEWEPRTDAESRSDLDLEAIWVSCRRRVLGWPTPANWVQRQWVEELRAEAFLVCLRALDDYEPARRVPLGAYLRMRVLGQLLTRYRQERRYAHQSGTPLAVDPIDRRSQDHSGAESLARALARLPHADRFLIEELVWHQRTERQIAERLGISQQAVSKRWRVILNRLRLALASEVLEPEHPPARAVRLRRAIRPGQGRSWL